MMAEDLSNVSTEDLLGMLQQHPQAQSAIKLNDMQTKIRARIDAMPGALKSKTAANLASIAVGAADPILGLNSLLDKGVYGAGQFITSAGGMYPNKVSDWMGEAAKSGEKIAGMADSALQAERGAAGQSGFDMFRLAGNVVSPVNAVMPPVTRLIDAVGAGAAFGAMQPTAEGSSPLQPALNAATGAAGGAAGYGLGKMLSAGGTAAPTARQAAVDLLRNEGVEPPIGATMGGGARMLEQKGESVPFIGGAIRKGETRANSELNQAVYNRVLEPIGQNLPKDMAPGREAIQAINSKVHDAYDAALSGVKVPQDRQLGADIQGVVANASTMLPDRQAQLGAWVKKIQDNFLHNDGVLDGERLKGLSSDLRRGAQSLLYSSDSEARDLGNSVDQLDDILLQAARRSNPSTGPALDAADKAYTGLVRLNRAAGYNSAAGTGGVFTPANLASAIGAEARGKAAKAMGTAPMQDLSDAAAMVLKPTLPNSGTADRVLTPALLAGSAIMHNPVLAAGMGGAMGGSHALYSRPATSAINSMIRGKALAALLKSAPGLTGIAGRLPPAILQQLQAGGAGSPVGP